MKQEVTNNTKGSSPVVGLPDIPAQVFASFLQALIDGGGTPELVDRLRKTLLKDKIFSDRALKDAVLGEDAAV